MSISINRSGAFAAFMSIVQGSAAGAVFFVKRKPRDSRVDQNRLTDEKKPPIVIKWKRPASRKYTIGGYL